jgi:superfamily II DNA/RNA helicase
MTHTFASLGLRPEVLRAVADSGYERPTPIQEQTIPLLLAGRTCSVKLRLAQARRRPFRCRC